MDEGKEEVATANKMYEEFMALCASTGWTASHEKLGVVVEQKFKEGESVGLIKGVGTINCAPADILPYLTDVKKRKLWDTFYEDGREVKEVIKDELGYVHFWTQSRMTVWSRDFAVLVYKKDSDDGGFVITARSTPAAEKLIATDESKYVRGKVVISGFNVKPVKKDGDKVTQTEITYIFQVDPAGWLPSAAVNTGNTYQPLGIIGIRKQITGSTAP